MSSARLCGVFLEGFEAEERETQAALGEANGKKLWSRGRRV